MFLLKTSWDNIKFHKKRSILSILLISIASSAILLYRGFVEYTEQGSALTFIESSGHIQAAVKGYWDEKNSEKNILDAAKINSIKKIFLSVQSKKKFDAVLNFQGLIGTEKNSSIFWGAGYDEPHTLGASSGEPVFDGDTSLVLGRILFNSLNIKLQEDTYVNILSSVGSSGLLAGSFAVSGTIDTGVPQNDAGFVIASRKALLDFFEIEDTASYMRLFLKNEDKTEEVKKFIDSYFEENNLPFETKTWKELNPSWQQISDLFNIQFSVISSILCLLIFVALTQSISASFMERIGEFGTMEAIGLKKSVLICILILEVCILAFAGIIGGIILAKTGNFITEIFNIRMTPPDSDRSYLLVFLITSRAFFVTQTFIFITALSAVIYPVYTIMRHSCISLINYNNE